MPIGGDTVLDPSQGLHTRRDGRLGDGRVVELGRACPGSSEAVLDGRDRLVVPGL